MTASQMNQNLQRNILTYQKDEGYKILHELAKLLKINGHKVMVQSFYVGLFYFSIFQNVPRYTRIIEE